MVLESLHEGGLFVRDHSARLIDVRAPSLPRLRLAIGCPVPVPVKLAVPDASEKLAAVDAVRSRPTRKSVRRMR